jgi:hypothetical protein
MNWIKHDEKDTRLRPTYPYVEHESEYGWVLGYHKREQNISILSKVWEDHEENLWKWCTEDGSFFEPDEITHWMPIPPPPE